MKYTKQCFCFTSSKFFEIFPTYFVILIKRKKKNGQTLKYCTIYYAISILEISPISHKVHVPFIPYLQYIVNQSCWYLSCLPCLQRSEVTLLSSFVPAWFTGGICRSNFHPRVQTSTKLDPVIWNAIILWNFIHRNIKVYLDKNIQVTLLAFLCPICSSTLPVDYL